MKNTILFGNQSLTRFTAEIFAKILQNILRIFVVAKNRNFYMHCEKNGWLSLFASRYSAAKNIFSYSWIFFEYTGSQVRIAGTENTAQYWTNLGSHKLANITGPISAFKSAQRCPNTGTVHWKSKFPMLAPKLGPAMALYWAESRHYSGKLCCMSKSQCPAQ